MGIPRAASRIIEMVDQEYRDPTFPSAPPARARHQHRAHEENKERRPSSRTRRLHARRIECSPAASMLTKLGCLATPRGSCPARFAGAAGTNTTPALSCDLMFPAFRAFLAGHEHAP